MAKNAIINTWQSNDIFPPVSNNTLFLVQGKGHSK